MPQDQINWIMVYNANSSGYPDAGRQYQRRLLDELREVRLERQHQQFRYSSGSWTSTSINACINDPNRMSVGVIMNARIPGSRDCSVAGSLSRNAASCSSSRFRTTRASQERMVNMWLFRRLRGPRDERGYVALLVAMFAATILMPLCAISVDVARWYVEVQRVQNAADAAAMAGVTYLPDDFASAKSTAITVAGRNGYPNSGSTSVSVSIGDKPTQLVVTVSSKIGNAFGTAFGVNTHTIVRSATADFNGPAPMGSPCNTFGNEPPGAGTGSNDPVRGPNTSVIVAPPGGASCTSNPQFWGAIAGPDTPKGNGDEFMTRTCNSGNAGCTGTTNDEFDPQGYFYIVRVNPAAVSTPVTLQIYDPAWVENGDTCSVGPTGTMKNNMNAVHAHRRHPAVLTVAEQLLQRRRQQRDGRDWDHHVLRTAYARPTPTTRSRRRRIARERVREAVPAVLVPRHRYDAHGDPRHDQQQDPIRPGDLQQAAGDGLPPVGAAVHFHSYRAR